MKYTLTKVSRFGWSYEIHTSGTEAWWFFFGATKGKALTKEGADKKARKKIAKYEEYKIREIQSETREYK